MAKDLLCLLCMLAFHLVTALAWHLPVSRLLRRESRLVSLSVAYVWNAVLIIAVAYGLDCFAAYSVKGFWATWGALWLLAVLLCPKRSPEPAQALPLWAGLFLSVCLVCGAYIRLFDPLTNSSLSGCDAYALLTYLCGMLRDGIMIATYPAGLDAWLGHLQYGCSPMALSRFAPQLVATGSILVGFAFWRRHYGLPGALLSTAIYAGSVFIYPILAFHTMFPQLTTLAIALPILTCTIPLALHKDHSTAIDTALAALALVFVAYTSTYFALLITGLVGGWCVVVARRRLHLARTIGILALVPLLLVLYYRVALPCRTPDKWAHMTEQSRNFLRITKEGTVGSNPRSPALDHPIARVAVSFMVPKRWAPIRASASETGVLLIAVWVGVIHLCRRPQHPQSGFSGFVLLVCVASAATGMFELPGYQGRMLYVLSLLLIPVVGALVADELLPLLAGWFSVCSKTQWRLQPKSLRALALMAACVSIVPTLLSPPVIGFNTWAPFPLRTVPDDNILMSILLADRQDKNRSLLLVRSDGPAPLRSRNLAKMKKVISPIRVTDCTVTQFQQETLCRTSNIIYFAVAPADADDLFSYVGHPKERRWECVSSNRQVIVGRIGERGPQG